MAGIIASSDTRFADGRPGRLTTRALPRMPAVCRDRMAVGTCSGLLKRSSSPKPGIILWQAASVPSGVRSRGAVPVPPVVSTRATLTSRTLSTPSGTSLSTGSQGMASRRESSARMADRPHPRRGPAAARSETARRPGRAATMATPR